MRSSRLRWASRLASVASGTNRACCRWPLTPVAMSFGWRVPRAAAVIEIACSPQVGSAHSVLMLLTVSVAPSSTGRSERSLASPAIDSGIRCFWVQRSVGAGHVLRTRRSSR